MDTCRHMYERDAEGVFRCTRCGVRTPADRMPFNAKMAMRHNQYRDTLAAIVRCYDSLSELPASCVSELRPFIEDAVKLLPPRLR